MFVGSRSGAVQPPASEGSVLIPANASLDASYATARDEMGAAEQPGTPVYNFETQLFETPEDTRPLFEVTASSYEVDVSAGYQLNPFTTLSVGIGRLSRGGFLRRHSELESSVYSYAAVEIRP